MLTRKEDGVPEETSGIRLRSTEAQPSGNDCRIGRSDGRILGQLTSPRSTARGIPTGINWEI